MSRKVAVAWPSDIHAILRSRARENGTSFASQARLAVAEGLERHGHKIAPMKVTRYLNRGAQKANEDRQRAAQMRLNLR